MATRRHEAVEESVGAAATGTHISGLLRGMGVTQETLQQSCRMTPLLQASIQQAPLGSDFHPSRLSLKSTNSRGDESPPKNSLQEERFDEKQRTSQANKELITSTKNPQTN